MNDNNKGARMTKMTEDDTFNRLRRCTFEQALIQMTGMSACEITAKEIIENTRNSKNTWWTVHSNSVIDITVPMLHGTGWTMVEINQEINKRIKQTKETK